ncbi:MAG TPA: hypothetical protein VE978_27485 [Chitinophagales bacterium]|nr:hypothetical protein [Chitinophagales bacterium]
MRALYTFILLFLIASAAIAQNAQMRLSEYFQIKNGKGFFIPVHGDSTGYYALTCDTFEVYQASANTDYIVAHKLHNKLFSKKYIFGESESVQLDEIFSNLKPREIAKQKLYLIKFDTSMKFLWKKEVSYRTDYYLVNIIPTDDKMYFFFKTWNKNKKASALYYTYLKTRSSLSSKYIQIDTIKLKNKNWEEGSFKVSANDDYSRIVTYNLLPDGHYKAGVYNVTMFNKEMKQLWKRQIDFDFPGNYYSFSKVLINDNKAFFLAKVKKKYSDPYAYAIYVVGRGNDENKMLYIPILNAQVITGMDMQFDEEGNILLTGFYSHGSYETPLGVFTAKFSTNDQDIGDFNTHDFTSEDDDKSGDKNFAGLHFRNFYMNKNGTQTIVAEYYGLQKFETNFPLKYDKRGNYPYQNLKNCVLSYGDVVVMQIDKEANIQWIDAIDKKAISGSGVEASYASVMYNDVMYVLYNESAKNSQGDPQLNGVGNAFMNTIDLNGEMKQHTLFNTEETGVLLLPKLHYYQDDDEVLLFLYKKQKYKLGIVKLG